MKDSTIIFRPEIEVIKFTHDDNSISYGLAMHESFIASYSSRDELMAALEVMLQGVIS